MTQSKGRLLRGLKASHSLHQLTTIIVILAAWQLASGTILNTYYLSTPAVVAAQLYSWASDGTLWPNLVATLTTTAFGFTIASIVAIPLALLISASNFLDDVLSPFIYAAYSLPKIVLAPGLILWLGIGQAPAIVLSSVTAFFLIFFNLYLGLKNIPRVYADTAALMGASAITTALKFRLPAASSYLAVGLSQGIIFAFHGTIVGEMTASNTGIGYLIVFAGSEMNSKGVVAGILIVAALSVMLIALLNRVLRYFNSDWGRFEVG